jgi:thymidylate kinase
MTRERSTIQKPLLISFSGIDGAGKSTQIEVLCNRLRQAGLSVRRLAFWDDVAALTRFRELASHTIFKSEKGIGAPDKPVNRRDKNVQTWYMTPARYLICFLDNISLCFAVWKARAGRADVVIFDRYLFDELANLPLHGWVTRAVVRLLLAICPSPNIAYFLDADPERARERKPEYPVEFLRNNRAAYVELARLAGMTVVAPGLVEEVSSRIWRKVLGELASSGGHFAFSETANSSESS